MIRPLLLIALALTPAASMAGPKSMAHRPAIDRLEFAGDLTETATCVTRYLGQAGHTKQYPISDGIGVDLGMGQGMFSSADGPAMMTINFHDAAGARYMSVLYRHPMSAKLALRLVREQGKSCFAADWNRWAAANGAKPIKP